MKMHEQPILTLIKMVLTEANISFNSYSWGIDILPGLRGSGWSSRNHFWLGLSHRRARLELHAVARGNVSMLVYHACDIDITNPSCDPEVTINEIMQMINSTKEVVF